MVGDIVDGASQWDFPHGPGGIVGQVSGQDADPQLSLWDKHGNRHKTGQKAGN